MSLLIKLGEIIVALLATVVTVTSAVGFIIERILTHREYHGKR